MMTAFSHPQIKISAKQVVSILRIWKMNHELSRTFISTHDIPLVSIKCKREVEKQKQALYTTNLSCITPAQILSLGNKIHFQQLVGTSSNHKVFHCLIQHILSVNDSFTMLAHVPTMKKERIPENLFQNHYKPYQHQQLCLEHKVVPQNL